MNRKGNLTFIKGNKLAVGNRGGGRKRAELSRMLEPFGPRVVEILQERLNATDPADRWATAKELMPYIWARKTTVAVPPEGEERPTLADYLRATAQNGHDPEPDPDKGRGTLQ